MQHNTPHSVHTLINMLPYLLVLVVLLGVSALLVSRQAGAKAKEGKKAVMLLSIITLIAAVAMALLLMSH